jgi:hypothetical protein
MLTTIEKNSNKVLVYLSKATINDRQLIDDNTLMVAAELSSDEVRSVIKKLHADGYTGGGKLMTTLSDAGREFIELGGYKRKKELSSVSKVGLEIGKTLLNKLLP